MHSKTTQAFVLVCVCLAVACGGGGSSLVPKVSPVPGDGGPAVARTPFGRSGTPAASGSPGAGPSASPFTPPTPGPLATYTVESGDTPNAIASKLNIPSDRIESWV